MVMAIAGAAIAQDLGYSWDLTVKMTPTITYTPPAEVKVGGDTVDDATVIPGLPYSDTGNTCEYVDRYDEACPFADSSAEDVVYSFTPGSDMWINVDLCGSSYDTKTYIYDIDLNLIACNDDFYYGSPCGYMVSKIQGAPLVGGATYFIVVDGFIECGVYLLEVTEYAPPSCEVTCDVDAVPEGEPPLVPGYIDAWNGGCYSDPPVYQLIDWANTAAGEAKLCGVIGWYDYIVTDTDWFSAISLSEMTFTVESEYPCNIYLVDPNDCEDIYQYGIATADCGVPATLVVPANPSGIFYFLVKPVAIDPPPFPVFEFTYYATLTGHEWDEPVPQEEMSWGGVKALYR
jgi:hypothetical protein